MARTGRKSPENPGSPDVPGAGVALPDVIAAGAVVVRDGGDEVLLVHRPRYDDWSFPKGKLDPGEHVTTCAVREVEEETGVRVRLGVPLADQRYELRNGRGKTVHYWVARPVGDDDLTAYEANDEIDHLEWVDWATAARRLSYDHDRDTLAEAREHRQRTRTLVVQRHTKALPRKQWSDDDRLRPLHPTGEVDAGRLVDVLGAYAPTMLTTSSSTRCVATLQPYARTSGRTLHRTDALSEEDATAAGVAEVVAHLSDEARYAVLCTHRPVLPHVYAALGLPPTALDPGGFVVVHHRKGRIVAVEEYASL